MGLPVIEYLGWAATAVFVSSYFCARAETLKRVQMAGAAMWIAYGLAIGASPVVAANLLVLVAAAWTARRATASLDATPRSLRSDQAPT
jgi:hypothetical protein